MNVAPVAFPLAVCTNVRLIMVRITDDGERKGQRTAGIFVRWHKSGRPKKSNVVPESAHRHGCLTHAAARLGLFSNADQGPEKLQVVV